MKLAGKGLNPFGTERLWPLLHLLCWVHAAPNSSSMLPSQDLHLHSKSAMQTASEGLLQLSTGSQ